MPYPLRRSPINGGLDVMLQNEHWTCVPPPSPPSRWLRHVTNPCRVVFLSTAPLSTRVIPDGTLPTPPLYSLEEDKVFENTLAQLGEVDGEDPFTQVSPRLILTRIFRLIRQDPDLGDPRSTAVRA